VEIVMTALVKLTRSEVRLFLREPIAVFFGVAFPAILVIVLGSIPGFREPDKNLGGLRIIDLYVTISIALTLAMLGLQLTPAVLAGYRERGVLRRLSATPVHPALLLAAQLISAMLTAIVAVALVLVVGRVAFAVPVPRQFVGFVIAFLMSAAALYALGLLVAAIAPTGKAGNAIGVVLFFPVMFFAGLYVPREALPGSLNRIGDFTPLGAGEQAMHDALTRSWPHAGQLLVLAGYLVVCGAAAARLFRWE
jgi:ABC-2 type transport system permease protein